VVSTATNTAVLIPKIGIIPVGIGLQ